MGIQVSRERGAEMKYDIEWLKFKIIAWLNTRYDDACWTNLVLWAVGHRSFRETFGEDGDWCKQTCTNVNGGYAYCGKCVETGRLKE